MRKANRRARRAVTGALEANQNRINRERDEKATAARVASVLSGQHDGPCFCFDNRIDGTCSRCTDCWGLSNCRVTGESRLQRHGPIT